MRQFDTEKQKKDVLEFVISIAAVIILSLLGALLSGVEGMFWFGAAALIVAIVQLHKRESFYKWIHVFFLCIVVLNKFLGLGS